MRFANIRTVCEAGGKVNEDSCSTSERHLLALDGASGLYGLHLIHTGVDGSDAAWLARRGAEEYGWRLEESDAAMDTLCLEAAQLLGEEFCRHTDGAEGLEAQPSAGIAALRLREGRLEYYALGDLTILLRFRDGRVAVIHDRAVTDLDNKVLREMVRLAEINGESVAEQREKVQGMLRRHRELRNREGGYMCFDPSAAGADKGLAGEFPAKDVETVALLSDGIADAVPVYEMAPDYAAFLLRLETEGPAAVLAILRRLQQEDPGFNCFPRFKMGDDATVVLADILE